MGSQVRVLYRAPKPHFLGSEAFSITKTTPKGVVFWFFAALQSGGADDTRLVAQLRRLNVTEIFLHGLNVVAALDRGNGESMTQIVEACGRCADVSNNCA